MPEIKRTFQSGVMDLGTDDRLMQNGTYRYARNVDVVGSESSDQGVIQNIRGNVIRGKNVELPEDAITIGAVSNPTNDKLYYFWVSRNYEGIYEYDSEQIDPATGGGSLVRIIEFSKNDVNSRSFLNFDPNRLITGAVVVGDLLIWTDGYNPVRKINIERFRGSGNYERCPSNPETGEQVCPTGAFVPVDQDDRPIKLYLVSDRDPQFDGMNNPLVTLGTGSELLDENQLYENIFAGDLINLAKRPPLFPPSITKIVDGITDGDYSGDGAKAEDKLFDTLPRFAIRYRYTDGETSAISPFSAPAFMPREYSQNSETGIMECMTNFLDRVELTFDVGEQEVKEIDVLYKESDSSTIYLVETINKEDYYTDANGDTCEPGSSTECTNSSSAVKRKTHTFTYDGGKVYQALPSSELARIYDNVPITAKALTMAGNRLVLGNFQENYGFVRQNENGEEINPNFTVEIDSDPKNEGSDFPFRTLKTGRDYQVGIVYLDREGRQSPTIVSDDNTFHVGYDQAGQRNKLKVTIAHEAPYWATHYRPFIKQNKGVFYNIIPRFSKFLHKFETDADDDPIVNQYYLLVHDNDKNKADVGDVLVLKKTDRERNDSEPEYWRIVEQRRFIRNTTDTVQFADNLLPKNIPNDYEGLYWVLAPIDGDGNPLLAANPIVDYPASGANDAEFQTIWETVPNDNVGDFYWEGFETYRIVNGSHTNSNIEIPRLDSDIQFLDKDGKAQDNDEGKVEIVLNWFNCYGYSNGVESMVVEDRFNAAALDQGARASTIQENYRRYDKNSWLIHSGVYVDSTNLNRLNEFNVSLPLQKELDVNDGSIQKLHFRDTNLFVFQENKVKNVPINKNVIVTADGGNLSTAGSQFFGVERSYDGEYGIAENPEAFATYGSRIYFADKNRGAILRLSNNGITEISKNGVEAYVRKQIADAHFIKLSYNDYADELDISFQNENSFSDYDSNRRVRRISMEWGAPDDICNTSYSDLNFEDVYTLMHKVGVNDDNTQDFVRGDVIYVDEDRTVPFNGEYRHYRVQTGSGAEATYDTAIQISKDGVVVDIVDSCSASYGYNNRHRYFTISSESFQSQVDACANALVDQVAYFGPGKDQNHYELANEPQEGNYIYESYRTLLRSDRSGWYKINVATYNNELSKLEYDNYVILIRDGKVLKTFHCDRIEKGRVKFVGSEKLDVIANENTFDRNLRICTADHEESWWIKSTNADPLIGDIVYENNFTDDPAPAGYIALTDGRYLTIDSTGKITAINSCSEKICTNDPYELFVPDTEVPLRGDTQIGTITGGGNFVTAVSSGLRDYYLNDYYETCTGTGDDCIDGIQYRVDGDPTKDTCTHSSHTIFSVNTVTYQAFQNKEVIGIILGINGHDYVFDLASSDYYTATQGTAWSTVWEAIAQDLDDNNSGLVWDSTTKQMTVNDIVGNITRLAMRTDDGGGDSDLALDDLTQHFCLKSVKNDLGSTVDVKAIETGDVIGVTLSWLDDDAVEHSAELRSRATVGDDAVTLKIDNSSEVFEFDDQETYSIRAIRNYYKYNFVGVQVTTEINDKETEITVGLPEITLEWNEKGVKTYPKLGLYEQVLEGYSTDIGVEENRKYKLTNSGDTDEILVSPVIVKACYDKVTGGNESHLFMRTTGPAATEAAAIGASGPCELLTNDTVYYNDNIYPKTLHTSNTLDEESLITEITGFVADNWWGVAYSSADNTESTATVTHLVRINDKGQIVDEYTIDCGYKNNITLGFIPATESDNYNNGYDAACKAYDDNERTTYWANNSDWEVSGTDNNTSDDITMLVLKDGMNTTATDGWYSTDTHARKMTSGVLEDDDTACPTKFTSVSFKFSSASGKEACTSTTNVNVFSSTNDTNLSNAIQLYADAYAAENAPSGYYSNGTLTGEWNKQTGRFTYAFCENNKNVDVVDDPIPKESETITETEVVETCDVLYTERVQYQYVAGPSSNSPQGACSGTTRRFFSTSSSGFAARIFLDNCGSSEAPSGHYLNGGTIRYYTQGTGFGGTLGQCQTPCGNQYEGLILSAGNSETAACNSPATTLSGHISKNTGFSTGNSFYDSVTGEYCQTPSPYDTSYGYVSYTDSGVKKVASISGGKFGTVKNCTPVTPPAVWYGQNLRPSLSGGPQACQSSPSQYYTDESTFISSTQISVFSNGFPLHSVDAFFSDGNIWKQWSVGQGKFIKSGSCTSYDIVIGGTKHGNFYTTKVGPGTTLTGYVDMSSGSGKTVWLSAVGQLNSCPPASGTNVWATPSSVSLSFGGSNGNVANMTCNPATPPHTTANGSSVYLYNITSLSSSSGAFSVTVENDDWAALGAELNLTLNLTVT